MAEVVGGCDGGGVIVAQPARINKMITKRLCLKNKYYPNDIS
jgi:hypothetical protein